jgi:hypothetical protein
MTDTERLDWLDRQGDIGYIRLDPDLAGTIFITWNQFQADSYTPTNIRDAIDKVIEKETKKEQRLKEMLGE